ncbi:hypothetical protein DMH15_29570 [Streptomyces sp. WAC 06725]|uniref:hypothetical protein n=1 Tax=Streptomyces sp. WAC 06725 TaxID=2203209 RepID=UPI000F73F233|nr:hypothetical protein [Streptomyces sp. WAC 06725]RSO26424.1 hypothetical protein DMH15_29570 [Streptomyces sp. WAC 06725]
MPLSSADIKAIWAYELDNPADDGTRQAGTYVRYADLRQQTLLGRLDNLAAAHKANADRLGRNEDSLKKLTDLIDTLDRKDA